MHDAHSDWHRLGAGLSVRFSIDGERFDAEWQPRVPTKREMRRVVARYRAARELFLAAVAQRSGGTVLCVELPI